MPINGDGDTGVASGLTTDEAEARLREVGPNGLPAAERVPTWKRVIEQFVGFFALMLWVAGGLAFIAGLPQLGVAIFVVIVLNGLFAFAQEYRAEKVRCSSYGSAPSSDVTVIRDGERSIVDASALVPGDLVVLGGGGTGSARTGVHRESRPVARYVDVDGRECARSGGAGRCRAEWYVRGRR